MKRNELKIKSGFYLRCRDGLWYKASGTSDDGFGETAPYIHTTRYLSEARCFDTFKQARASQRMIREKYGKVSEIIKPL